MKQIKSGSHHKLPPAILFSNDVVRLYSFLKEAGHSSIQIQSSGYVLDSPDELDRLAKELEKEYVSQLEIKAEDPYISIEFEPYSARVYISEDSNSLRGLIVRVTELVSTRKRRFWRFTTDILPSLPAGASVPAFLESRIEVGVSLLILAAILYFWSFRQSMRRYSIIWLKSKDQAPGFFERNKDKLILAVFSGILGALAKAVFDWLRP